MRKSVSAIALAVALGAVLVAPATFAPVWAGAGKTVVELFTSQGCSSCPPADAFLGELARRDDVLALSFHVDYWNYLGWKDPFSSAEATARQRSYRQSLGARYVYTPQMAVGGTGQAVGSGKAKILSLIRAVRDRPGLDILVRHHGAARATISIASGPPQKRPAAVWLMFYDKRHVTRIRRGENQGVELVNTNVVRVFKRVGSWSGGVTVLNISLKDLGAAGRDGCAIIVQAQGNGAILGAISFPLPRG